MSKAKTKNEEHEQLQQWYKLHDYGRVEEILSHVREVLLEGDIEEAAQNLKRSYHFAVFSIQTRQYNHELAFELWMRDYTAEEACAEGGAFMKNQKADWIVRTETDVDWRTLARAVRMHVKQDRITELLEMQEHLTGVSYSKWAFTVAMTGVWEVLCIDANMKNYLEIEGRLDLRHNGGVYEYMALIERVAEEIDADVPPFIKQWAIYDYERGSFTVHEAFFQHAYPFVSETFNY